MEKEESVLDIIFQLIELSKKYCRQELKALVENTLLKPAKKVGLGVATAIIASTLLALASIFFAVGLFQLLCEIVGKPWIAYLLVGAIFSISGLMVIIGGSFLRDD